MNTAALLSCQTGGRQDPAGRGCLGLAMVVWAFSGMAGPVWSAEPVGWQRELDALRLSDVALAVLPPPRSPEATEADRRLGELFRQLAARYPREAAVHKAAGDHFWRTGETSQSISEWLAAQDLDPTDGETASALGSAWLREGRTRSACEQFQRAVAARPEIARYHYDLGNALFLFRHQVDGLPGLPDEAATTHEALTQLRLARDLATGNLEYARTYAETFYGVPNPDWQEALGAWEHVRRLSPEAPDFALSHLARVSVRLAQPAQAESYLEMIHDPRFGPLQAKLRGQVTALRERKAAAGSPP